MVPEKVVETMESRSQIEFCALAVLNCNTKKSIQTIIRTLCEANKLKFEMK